MRRCGLTMRTYSEPTELWRLVDATGELAARAVIDPARPRTTLVWFINSELPSGAEDFDEWERALLRAVELNGSSKGAGWF